MVVDPALFKPGTFSQTGAKENSEQGAESDVESERSGKATGKVAKQKHQAKKKALISDGNKALD